MPPSRKVEDLKKLNKIENKTGKLEDKKVTLAPENSDSLKQVEVCEDNSAVNTTNMIRNPITGEGCPEGKQKPSSKRRDGNPVLGTGYQVKTQKVNSMPVGGKSTILIT